MKPKINEFITKHPYAFVILLCFIGFILYLIFSPTSDTNNKSYTNEKIKIKNKIEENKEKSKKKIDYMKIDEVTDKIIYNILRDAEYNSKTNKTKLKFSTINDLQNFEDELIKNKEQIYKEAYNKSIDTLKNTLKWLNPMDKGLGLNPDQRLQAAIVSLVNNISDKDKIIYSHLYKTKQLENIIKGLLRPIDYTTLIQTKSGIAGLMAGSLLL